MRQNETLRLHVAEGGCCHGRNHHHIADRQHSVSNVGYGATCSECSIAAFSLKPPPTYCPTARLKRDSALAMNTKAFTARTDRQHRHAHPDPRGRGMQDGGAVPDSVMNGSHLCRLARGKPPSSAGRV